MKNNAIIAQRRALLRAAFMTACVGSFLAGNARGQAIYRENFDELPLGPNVEETLAGSHVWTHTAPDGWVHDDSKMPGFGDPARDGITEWAGWSFANKDWWVAMAGDQRRSEFTYGQGTVMIADNDEWDDATHAKGFFDASVTSKAIDIPTVAADSLVLVYDSSWRPEATDDGDTNPDTGFPLDPDGNKYNDQTGYITLKYDAGTPMEIQRWTSISDAPTYHDHLPNESVVIPLSNPGTAKTLQLTFGMEKAANDWWWAVDNIAVGVPPFTAGITNDGSSFGVKIVEALGKSVDQSKGVTAQIDGKAATPIALDSDGTFVWVNYTQAPQVFAPGSRHTVEVKYTSNENKAMDETIDFVAPTYAEVSATPSSVSAKITEKEWISVDESKGITFQVDGTSVSPVNVTRADSVLNAKYVAAMPYAANSTHTLVIGYTTTFGQQLSETNQFTVPNYPTIPASLATATGTGAQPGMKWRTYQIEATRGTTIAEAEAELAGTLGPDIHDTTDQGADGFFSVDYVNFDQDTGDAGNFSSSAEPPQDVLDDPIPGIIPFSGNNDNIAAEALTFVEFPTAGIYTMVVNSDDGFQLSVGTTNTPKAMIIGQFDGGRGSADTVMYFKVEQPGVYFFRLLWFEGGSGANVEWFTVGADGSRALVGGTQTGSLKAYKVRTVAEPTGTTSGGIVSYNVSSGKLVITYDGTLKSATDVSGPFQPVTGASSPYSVTPAGSHTFYIAK